MPRLINADDANVDRICCYYGGSCYLEDVQEWLDDQPTIDAEPVVRCKDCKERCPESATSVEHCTVTGIQTEDDDFCSYGVRREDEAMKQSSRERLMMVKWDLKNLVWVADDEGLKEELRRLANEIAKVLENEWEEDA